MNDRGNSLWLGTVAVAMAAGGYEIATAAPPFSPGYRHPYRVGAFALELVRRYRAALRMVSPFPFTVLSPEVLCWGILHGSIEEEER